MQHQLFLFFSTFIPFAAQAQEAQLQPTIEVTATRVAETVDASLADISVITRPDIDASHAPDLIELLRLQAGIDVVRGGGAGEQTSIFVRGTNSNHVLVLIDGVRVASANTGAFAFENLPLDAVERIEIVRGPRASYWGSDAIGGVIQIFTRKLDAPHVAASYGSYRSADGSVGIGQWSDAGGFSVQFGARHVGGFSATNAGICNGPDDPYCIYNPDDNGYHNRDIVARGAYRVGAQTLSATVFRNEGGVSFDNGGASSSSGGVGYTTTLDQAVGANLEGPLTPDWNQRLSLGTSREDLDTPAFADSFRSTREQAAWVNDVTLSTTQHIVAGADYSHDRGVALDTSGFGPSYDASRNDSGVFAGWHAQSGMLNSELSGRYDDNSAFGGALSGSGAIGWKATDELRLTASYGNAFRAPTLNELYSPGYGGYYAGNPQLDPERSRTAEIGLDWRIDAANRLGVRAFSTRVHDLIDFAGGSTFEAINVAHAQIDGAELTHGLHRGIWSLDSGLTLQNPRDTDTGARLLRRPREKFSSVLTAAPGERASAGVEFVWSGKRADYGDTTLGAYALVNLRASYALDAAWQIGARLENLFDRDYELVHGYNTAGRSVYATVTWQPH
ncbi:MAG TPA: TonB-dependent receptor [Rudaea sp.]|nr:TonB-dependent receptor [Rudaea sp.]